MKHHIRQDFTIWAILTALMIFAASMFSHYTADLALWGDEAFSSEASAQPNVRAVIEFVEPDIHPPLYFLLLHGWRQVAGADVFWLRMPSLMAALLSVAITFRIGREMFGLRAAVVAAAMLITSDIVLSLVPEVRHYPTFLLFSVMSGWLYWRYTRGWDVRWGVAYGIASAAMLYTLYWGLFILAAHGVHLMMYHHRALRQNARRLFPALIVIILYAPWLPTLYSQVLGEGNGIDAGVGYNQAVPISWEGLKITLFQLFGVPEALFIGLAAAGVAKTMGGDYRPDERTAFLGLWLTLPLVTVFLAGVTGYNVLFHKPLIGLVPAMCLLVGHTLSQMRGWTFTLLAVILLAINLTTTGAEPLPRGPYWTVGDVLAQLLSPGDVLQIESNVLDSFVIEDHAQYAGARYAVANHGSQLSRTWFADKNRSVEDQLRGHERLWLIEYQRDRDIRPELNRLGYAQLSPTIDLGLYQIDNIRLTFFARYPFAEVTSRFGDQLALLTTDLDQRTDSLGVNLFWASQQESLPDYTVSVFLLNDAGALVSQHDGPPLNGYSPTSTWIMDWPNYDRHVLALDGLPPGRYRVGVKVYDSIDGSILPAEPSSIDDGSYIVIDDISN
jgi:hypothetical protein